MSKFTYFAFFMNGIKIVLVRYTIIILQCYGIVIEI
jgi:hypothetical protein